MPKENIDIAINNVKEAFTFVNENWEQLTEREKVKWTELEVDIAQQIAASASFGVND